jgi:hypothetical protein
MKKLLTYLYPTKEGEHLIKWRTEINDFEQRVLIPQFRLRIKNIIDVLNRMKNVCQEERANNILPYLFKKMNEGFGLKMPLEIAQKEADRYINRFDKIIDDDFLTDAQLILNKFEGQIDLNKFIEILIDLRNYCTGLLAVKNKTFTYAIGFGGILINPNNSDDIKTITPVETNIMWHPFNVHYNELCSIASSTIESIVEWENSQEKQKISYLNFVAHNMQLKGYRWSVFVAVLFGIVTAWFFFASSDYLLVKKYESELMKKEEYVNQLKNDLDSSANSLTNCRKDLDNLKENQFKE